VKTSVTLLAAVLLAGCSAGSKTLGSRAVELSPELEPLRFFLGRWHATAKDPRDGKAFELSYDVEPAMSGRWLMGRGKSEALELEIHDYWGKEPGTGLWMRTLFDSQGTVGTVRSKGWEGDTLVLAGHARAGDASVEVRETITRKAADRFDAVWEMKTPEGWVAYSVEQLVKR
jgi:hypothetical protein